MNPYPNQPFAECGFQLEITHDGSPTLRLQSSGESMHHFDGAAGESWYVYGLPLQQALLLLKEKASLPFDLKVVSIGLGLGYVEMLWALLAARFQKELPHCKSFEKPFKKPFKITLDSFEKVIFLQQNFCDWIKNQPVQSHQVYDLAFDSLIAANPKINFFDSTEEFKTNFSTQIKNKEIHFHQDILLFKETKKWNFICFDAFSKNTDQGLWDSDYLQNFLRDHAADDCLFATYAATTNLKNVLSQQGFHLIKRLGYSGKRECTLALRGKFTDDAAIFQTF